MTDANASTTWSYDRRGRVVSETETVAGYGPYTTGRAYDAADHVVSVAYPSGETVTTTYDTRGRPSTLAGWNGYVTGSRYTPLDQPRVITYANNLKTNYQYFGLDASVVAWAGGTNYGWLRRICVLPQASMTDCELDSTPPADALLNIALNYDKAANVIAYRDATPTKQQKIKLTYDGLNRLTSAYPDPGGVPNWTSVISYFTESYAYDATGDLLTHTTQVSGSAVSTFTLGYAAAKPHAATSVNGEQRYGYDANGNMTQRVEVSGTQRITYTQGWDIDNHLIAVTNTQGAVTRYAYDADGRRVLRTNPDGTKVAYVGDLYEVQVGSGVTTSYYFFGGQRVAVRLGGTLTYLHADQLGSASLATSGTGTRVSDLRYYPFGPVRFTSGSMPTDRRFTGQRHDTLINLISMGAREYSPLLGSFISADIIVPQPGNPQSLNRYSYANNRPLNLVDSSGHCATTPTGQQVCDSSSSTQSSALTVAPMDMTIRNPSPTSNGRSTAQWTIGPVPKDITTMLVTNDPGGALTLVGPLVAPVAAHVGAAAMEFVTTAAPLCILSSCSTVWDLESKARGQIIERAIGRSPQLSENFPIIDRFKNGVATSIKSINLNANTYQNLGSLEREVRGYIDQMSSYAGQATPWGGVRILPSEISVRALDLAIPADGVWSAQLSLLKQLQAYAAGLPVSVILNIIPVK